MPERSSIERGIAEAKAMREILETQKKYIAESIAKHDKKGRTQQLMIDFGDLQEDELRQLRDRTAVIGINDSQPW